MTYSTALSKRVAKLRSKTLPLVHDLAHATLAAKTRRVSLATKARNVAISSRPLAAVSLCRVKPSLTGCTEPMRGRDKGREDNRVPLRATHNSEPYRSDCEMIMPAGLAFCMCHL